MRKLFLSLMIVASSYASACTNFIVGKNASADGSVICDAHNPEKRPCHLKSAMEGIEKKLGSNTVEFLMENADAIFRDREIDGLKKPKRKKLFGIF